MVISGNLNRNASDIWNVANNVRRDIYVHVTYRDVILPSTVLLWLDAVLEEGKQAELDGRDAISEPGIFHRGYDVLPLLGAHAPAAQSKAGMAVLLNRWTSRERSATSCFRSRFSRLRCSIS